MPDDVPGYHVLEQVGQGGYSVVYRARQDRLDRAVALKVLKVGAVNAVDDAALRRFARESRLTGRLTGHPHVVTVLDTGMTGDGAPYIAMEYFEQGSLADRLQREGPLPVLDVLRVGVKIASALAAVHEAGVLHRDVKPQNILISRYGEPALTDFGIALLTESLDGTHTTAFTPQHAAPEVLNGETLRPASDVYALGSTMYQLLAGEPAFVSDPNAGLIPLIARIVSEPPPPIQRKDVPAEVFEAVCQMMAKDPDDRFPTAISLATHLRRLQLQLGHPVTELPVAAAAPPPVPATRGRAGRTGSGDADGTERAAEPDSAGSVEPAASDAPGRGTEAPGAEAVAAAAVAGAGAVLASADEPVPERAVRTGAPADEPAAELGGAPVASVDEPAAERAVRAGAPEQGDAAPASRGVFEPAVPSTADPGAFGGHPAPAEGGPSAFGAGPAAGPEAVPGVAGPPNGPRAVPGAAGYGVPSADSGDISSNDTVAWPAAGQNGVGHDGFPGGPPYPGGSPRLGGPGGPSYPGGPGGPPGPDAPGSKRGKGKLLLAGLVVLVAAVVVAGGLVALFASHDDDHPAAAPPAPVRTTPTATVTATPSHRPAAKPTPHPVPPARIRMSRPRDVRLKVLNKGHAVMLRWKLLPAARKLPVYLRRAPGSGHAVRLKAGTQGTTVRRLNPKLRYCFQVFTLVRRGTPPVLAKAPAACTRAKRG